MAECRMMRRMMVVFNRLDIMTGENHLVGARWVTRRCGAPLFSDAEILRGVCKMCNVGWIHPYNYPVSYRDEENE
jgi:hypothetical protein